MGLIRSPGVMTLMAIKVFLPLEDAIKVHQTRVKPCPDGLLVGYYWYGTRKGPGHPPKWVEKILFNEVEELEDEEPDLSMANVAGAEPAREPIGPEPTPSEVLVTKQADHH